MSSNTRPAIIAGDPVRHRTANWTGTVSETTTTHAWVNRDTSNPDHDTYPELVPLVDLELTD